MHDRCCGARCWHCEEWKKPMTTQSLNNHGIGASEIAAIAGLNPYASPWDIWLVKTGQKEPFEGNSFTEWGHRLEPAIRQAYADQTKATVMVPKESLFHRNQQWARATPDGIVIDQKPVSPGAVWLGLVQCKNVGGWVEKSWREAPPSYVQLQEQWEMYVTDVSRADVAVLIGGNDFRIYTVHRDDSLIADLVTIAAEFWQRVQTRTPPEIDGSDACTAHFEQRLARKDAVEIVADADLEQLMSEWHDLHIRIRTDGKRVDVLRNRLLAELASAQADRIRSERGTAKLSRRGGSTKTETNWRLIAEMLGSTKCSPDEWQTLVAANTETREAKETTVLSAPREWGKEIA